MSLAARLTFLGKALAFRKAGRRHAINFCKCSLFYSSINNQALYSWPNIGYSQIIDAVVCWDW